MAMDQATRFIEDASKDETLRASFMGGKAASELNPEDVVQAAAGQGYQFTSSELMSAFEGYMLQHAAELNPETMDPAKTAAC